MVSSSASQAVRCALLSRAHTVGNGASSPPLQPGGFFFWIWGRQATDSGFQADALWRRRRPQKSGSPPLFELSLQIERNNAHNPNSGGRDPAPGADFNTHRVLKVPKRRRRNQRRASMPWRRSAGTTHRSNRTAPAAFPESCRGTQPPALRAARDTRRLHELQRWRRKTHLGLSQPLQSF
jgi:hypothetical protein